MHSAVRDMNGLADAIFVNLHLSLIYILEWNALILDKYGMKLRLSSGYTIYGMALQ